MTARLVVGGDDDAGHGAVTRASVSADGWRQPARRRPPRTGHVGRRASGGGVRGDAVGQSLGEQPPPHRDVGVGLVLPGEALPEAGQRRLPASAPAARDRRAARRWPRRTRPARRWGRRRRRRRRCGGSRVRSTATTGTPRPRYSTVLAMVDRWFIRVGRSGWIATVAVRSSSSTAGPSSQPVNSTTSSSPRSATSSGQRRHALAVAGDAPCASRYARAAGSAPRRPAPRPPRCPAGRGRRGRPPGARPRRDPPSVVAPGSADLRPSRAVADHRHPFRRDAATYRVVLERLVGGHDLGGRPQGQPLEGAEDAERPTCSGCRRGTRRPRGRGRGGRRPTGGPSARSSSASGQ